MKKLHLAIQMRPKDDLKARKTALRHRTLVPGKKEQSDAEEEKPASEVAQLSDEEKAPLII